MIENNFAAKIPDLNQIGVQIVDNIYPYEEAKIRILNGGHSAVAYLAILSGLKTFDEALRHPTLKEHFEGWENEEVLPSITIDMPFDKAEYKELVTQRFLNAAIADSLERICMDGFTKLSIFIKPTIASCLALGIVPKYGYDVIASFYIFARHVALKKISRLPITSHIGIRSRHYWRTERRKILLILSNYGKIFQQNILNLVSELLMQLIKWRNNGQCNNQ